jgi:DNA-directed RNA polymerase subunit RPC12/RpoP
MGNICISCLKIKSAEYRLLQRTTNNEEFKLRNRIATIKSVYGLSYKEYENILKTQDYKCKICGKIFSKNIKNLKPHIDHNHKTNKIRGILCHNCNVALGLFNEDYDIILSALEYVGVNND